jgi:hypothetical protein
MVRTVAWGSSSSTSSPDAPVDTEICIREVVNSAGRAKESPSIDMKLGKLAKKMYMTDHPEHVFRKKQVYANGQLVSANLWFESQRPWIERALASL